MSEICFFARLLQKVMFRQHSQYSGGCELDYVKLTEEMVFVVFVYFAFADEDVVE